MDPATIVASQERFGTLTASWVQAVWDCNAFGVIAGESVSWQKFTGQTSEERAYYGWADVVHPSDRAAVLNHWHDAFEHSTAVDVEFRVRGSGGTWWWTHARAEPVFLRGAVAQTWHGVSLDVGRRRRSEIASREAEIRYEHIIESARDYAIVTVDAMGAIASWSRGAEATYGWTATQAVGRPLSIVLPLHERKSALLGYTRTSGLDDVRNFNAWHVCKDGSSVYVEGSIRALRGDAFEAAGFLLIGRDATERQRMERALADSEARYRTLVESVSDHAIFLVNAFGTIVEWTLAAEFVTGYAAEDAVGRHMSLLYTPEEISNGAVGAELVEAARFGRSGREAWRVRRDGRRIWSDEVTTALRDAEGRITGYSKVSRDLTDRQGLIASRERESVFAERERLRESLALAEEDERRRIARELHDTAGQHVTAISLGLSALGVAVDADSKAGRQVEALQRLIDLLASELHDVAVRLRPRTLDEFGLEEAIGATVRNWSRTFGIAADVQIETPATRLTPAIENALFRIVQEALTNVARHSHARWTSVVIERRDGHVHAIVEDDGIGFDANATPPIGLGLRGIRERVDSLGGNFQIESTPGSGTTIFVRIPVM